MTVELRTEHGRRRPAHFVRRRPARDLLRRAGGEEEEGRGLLVGGGRHHRPEATQAPAADDGVLALGGNDLRRYGLDVAQVVLHSRAAEVGGQAAAVAAQVKDVDLPAQRLQMATPDVPDPGAVSGAVA